VKPLSETRVEVKFSEKIKYSPVVMAGSHIVQFNDKSTSDNITFTGSIPYTIGTAKIKVTSYQDLSGNYGDAYSKDAEFTEDVTSPILMGSEIKIFNDKAYLILHYDEEVNPINGYHEINGTRDVITSIRTRTYGVSEDVKVLSYLKANGADKNDLKSVMIDISDSGDFPRGLYNVEIPYALVEDLSINENLSPETNLSFEIKKNASDGKKPYIVSSPYVASDNSYISMTFTEELEEDSALDLMNYTLNGIYSFKKAELSDDNKTVKLILAANNVNFSGKKILSVRNVCDIAGNIMDDYDSIVVIKENQKPFVDYAVLDDYNSIRVVALIVDYNWKRG
jgi:hypothetical protein